MLQKGYVLLRTLNKVFILILILSMREKQTEKRPLTIYIFFSIFIFLIEVIFEEIQWVDSLMLP